MLHTYSYTVVVHVIWNLVCKETVRCIINLLPDTVYSNTQKKNCGHLNLLRYVAILKRNTLHAESHFCACHIMQNYVRKSGGRLGSEVIIYSTLLPKKEVALCFLMLL